MVDLAIALDFGSSLGRAIYTTNTGYVKPEILLLDPHVIEVPEVSISNYEKYRVGKARPEDSSWVKLGDSYLAVGFLARRQFNTVHCLNALKVDSAIPLTLAMVGAIAQTKELGHECSLTLGVVLPWSEYKDREKLETALKESLASFIYRGEEYKVTLEKFSAFPEGAGLLARGRTAKKGQLLPRLSEINLAVLMVGYRNASLLVVERGQLTTGLTSDLGFSQMISKVKTLTSGQTEEVLLPAICSAREVSERTLDRLVRSQRQELREVEKQEIKEAIADAKQEYIATLSNWINQQIPPQVKLDEFLVGGGTAKYLKPELTQLLKLYSSQINWVRALEKRVEQAFYTAVARDYLAPRLTDVYGLFYKLLDKPLPRLKEVATRESA